MAQHASKTYVRCVTATAPATSGATVATPPIRLRFDVIDRWAAEHDATSDRAIAVLLGVNCSTLSRFRKGQMGPSLPRAVGIAAKLGISVEDLIETAAVR